MDINSWEFVTLAILGGLLLMWGIAQIADRNKEDREALARLDKLAEPEAQTSDPVRSFSTMIAAAKKMAEPEIAYSRVEIVTPVAQSARARRAKRKPSAVRRAVKSKPKRKS